MAYFITGVDFEDGDQVTSTNLDRIAGELRLASQSVDATTITLSSGVLSVGVIAATNIGADAVTTIKVLDRNITGPKIALLAVKAEHVELLSLTGSLFAEATMPFSKTLTADRAAQADMQSETAAHFVSPDVLKYHPGVAKAGGIVALTHGSATVTGGYNVTSATESGNDRVIALAVTMANTDYRVELAYEDSSPIASIPVVNTKTTSGFTISPGGEASGRKISFNVYGTLA